MVNNDVAAPGASTKNFFSVDQPSISEGDLVVSRARAHADGGGGGSQPLRSSWIRDMSVDGSPTNPIATVDSNTIAFRGQSEPPF